MSMLSKHLAIGPALLLGLALAGPARASDDVIRLALPGSSAPTITLGATLDDLDADTLTIQRYGYRGGYRGGYYGGYRGGYRGYYGGYRGYWGGSRWAGYGYRGYYGGYPWRGYYGGYRWGGYYRPYYYGYYRPYYNGFGYYRPRYYGGFYLGINIPISADADVDDADLYPVCSRTVVIRTAPTQSYYYAPPRSGAQPQPAPEVIPQMPRADESTYPYDGGPPNPIPMPPSSAPSQDKPTVIPYDKLFPGETVVSVQPKSQEKSGGKWNYPAYGEKPTRSGK
jgi:hypothetical protein